MAKYTPPEGWKLQAFAFSLDPAEDQGEAIRRHFGARRFAYNWAVEQLKRDLDLYREQGVSVDPSSLAGMRKRWNLCKEEIAVNRKDGLPWWRSVSKEAFSTGIADAVDAYWRWRKSRKGEIAGPRVGFPRFKKKGSDHDRYRITTGIFGPSGNRHVKVPRVGLVRVHENMRRLTRLLAKGRARILAATVKREGHRLFIVFGAEVQRWSVEVPASPHGRVGIDLGVRRLATVASADGTVVEVVENPRSLERELKELSALYRGRSRCTSKESVRYRRRTEMISVKHRRVAEVRAHTIHVATTRLAKIHGEIVVEGMNVAGLMRQKGLPGVRKRRRDLADAAMGEVRRQLRYKVSWYGGQLVEANPFFPSSKLCSVCGALGEPGWAEVWECAECGATHQRDDNAAVNLSRYSDSGGGTVGASERRGAGVRPSPERAAGGETSKLGELTDGFEPMLVWQPQ